MSSSTKFQHPTILDIAAQAGVAPMTVSRVINGTGYVSAELRQRVQRVVEEVGYLPNALARSLKRQRTRVVGILLPDIANPFSAELARSMQKVLLEKKYSAFITTTEQSVEREQAALRAFFDHRVDGVVVATMETRAGNDALHKFINRGMAIVMVGRALSESPVDRVTSDYWKGGYDAVEHLISLGHTRIGFLGASVLNAGRLRRFQGFMDALCDHGISVSEEWIIGSDSGPAYSTQQDGYEAMKRLLALPTRPSAVFARNDFTAFGAMCAIRDAGLVIPGDIAVVGFDNVPLASYFTPSLTTVEQPTAELGRKAAAMLLERIERASTEAPREICFPCRLIIRDSTVRGKDKVAANQIPAGAVG
jgi:DNA-binding LacI/PurR family transcriptional regulator